MTHVVPVLDGKDADTVFDVMKDGCPGLVLVSVTDEVDVYDPGTVPVVVLLAVLVLLMVVEPVVVPHAVFVLLTLPVFVELELAVEDEVVLPDNVVVFVEMGERV